MKIYNSTMSRSSFVNSPIISARRPSTLRRLTPSSLDPGFNQISSGGPLSRAASITRSIRNMTAMSMRRI